MSDELKRDGGLELIDPEKPGIYRTIRLFSTSFVITSELAQDESTLWLRLLGRDHVKMQAIEELSNMQSDTSLSDATMRLLVGWFQSLPQSVQQNLERDMSMNWQRAYEKWEQKAIKKGKAEGKAEAVVTVLECRGLSPTATQRKQILQCKDATLLDAWLRNAAAVVDVKTLLASRRRTTQTAA